MYRELSFYDRLLTEDDVRESLFLGVKHKFNGFVVPSHFLPSVKDFLPDGITISSPIDYPFGVSDQSVKAHAVITALRKGANAIDLVANNSYVINKKFGKFYDEVEAILNICNEHKASLRVVLEYRFYETSILISLVSSLVELGIQYIIPSTGEFFDPWDDNLGAAVEISSKTSAHVITNGNIWQRKHYDAVVQAPIFGVRFNSMSSVKSIFGV